MIELICIEIFGFVYLVLCEINTLKQVLWKFGNLTLSCEWFIEVAYVYSISVFAGININKQQPTKTKTIVDENPPPSPVDQENVAVRTQNVVSFTSSNNFFYKWAKFYFHSSPYIFFSKTPLSTMFKDCTGCKVTLSISPE